MSHITRDQSDWGDLDVTKSKEDQERDDETSRRYRVARELDKVLAQLSSSIVVIKSLEVEDLNEQEYFDLNMVISRLIQEFNKIERMSCNPGNYRGWQIR